MRLTTIPSFALAIVFLGSTAGAASPQDSNPFSTKGDVLRYVRTPKGCSLTINTIGNRGKYIVYTAPAKNFEEPIRVQFEAKDGTKRPDILVWADEIHWHDDVKSGTASGRIVVDDQREYRVETTYVEYNHLTGQIYCPRKTKIIQRSPDGTASHMTAESALLSFDKNGIRTAKFDRITEMNVEVPQDGSSPFKVDKGKAKGKAKTSEGGSKSKETAEKVVSMEERKMKKMEGPAE